MAEQTTAPGRKKVHAYDPVTLAYSGPVWAYECQIEAGHFLMPAHAVDDAPGEVPDGKVAYWRDGAWVVDDPARVPAEAPQDEARPEQMGELRSFRAATLVQAALDETARAQGYADITTAISYAEEPAVARFQVEGRRLRRWRSLVWEHFYGDAVQEGVRSGVLGDDALLAGLPMPEA